MRALEVLGIIAALFAAAAGVVYFLDEHYDRILSRRMSAWALLRDASQSVGNVGQADALQILIDQGANLQGANLRNASLSLVDLSDAKLASVDMENATIEWSRMNRAYLLAADLRNVQFRAVVLTEATLAGAKLQRSNLFSVVLDRADFSGADLSDATIVPQSAIGTDFSDANLSGAKFVLFHFGEDVHPAPFEPKYVEFPRKEGNIRILGGSISSVFTDRVPCFAWATEDHPPTGLPEGYGVVLVRDPQMATESCNVKPERTWPR